MGTTRNKPVSPGSRELAFRDLVMSWEGAGGWLGGARAPDARAPCAPGRTPRPHPARRPRASRQVPCAQPPPWARETDEACDPPSPTPKHSFRCWGVFLNCFSFSFFFFIS